MSLAGATILFRADAGLAIGNGHVMRCLTLADALKSCGARSVFASKRVPGHLNDTIHRRGFEVIDLPAELSWTEDASQTCRVLAAIRADWLIVDHYGLTHEWECAATAPGLHAMVIDDLADRIHLGKMLLDQNLGRHPTDYATRVSTDCKLLIGPRYALVRPSFARRRHSSLKRRDLGRCRHLLVALGGVDRENLTGAVLDALKNCSLPSETRVTIVLGPHAPWIDDVRCATMRFPTICELKVDVADMAALMEDADLAIGAAGTSAWERCTLGLPTLLLLLAENQRPGAAALDACGAGRILGSPDELPRHLSAVSAPEALRAMSRAAAKVTDGLGARRVVEQMAACV